MMFAIDCILSLFQIAMLKGFDGETDKLGNAERFYLALNDLPRYALRLDVMLIKVSEINQIFGTNERPFVMRVWLADWSTRPAFCQRCFHAAW